MSAPTGTIPVSIMIFTLDEQIHLPVCLESVSFSDDVILVDSGSCDATVDIARDAGARTFRHLFKGFGTQRNWALDNTEPKHEWILMLDADERVPEELRRAIERAVCAPPGDVAAYRVARRFYMWGKWLRYSSLYPTYVVRLIRNGRVRYADRGHAETQIVDGTIATLDADLLDENLKGVQEWLNRQNRYARHEAEYEVGMERGATGVSDFSFGDPLARREALKRFGRAMPLRPLWYFLYSYVVRQGFRDGREGLMFCYMRAVYQAMIDVHRYDLMRSTRRG